MSEADPWRLGEILMWLCGQHQPRATLRGREKPRQGHNHTSPIVFDVCLIRGQGSKREIVVMHLYCNTKKRKNTAQGTERH